MMQREAGALAGQPVQPCQNQAVAGQQQPKWPAGGVSSAAVSSEQLSLELHQVEREIGKRTREMALVRERPPTVSARDFVRVKTFIKQDVF